MTVTTEPLVAREVAFVLPAPDLVQDIMELGIPVERAIEETEDGLLTLTLVVNPEEQEWLEALGLVPLEEHEGSPPELDEGFSVLQVDEVKVIRAEYFNHYGGTFLSVEAKTSMGSLSTVSLRVYSVDTGLQIGGTMSRFVDAGQYMYHRITVRVTEVPSVVRVVSSAGGEGARPVVEWPSQTAAFPFTPDLLTGFVARYLDPTETDQVLEDLAAEFPGLCEVIHLPYPTNGYRRQAMGVTGGTGSRAIVWYTYAWGHEGGNDIKVHLVDPGAPDQPLEISFDENSNTVVVSAATGPLGEITTTAGEVIAAVNAIEGFPVYAFPYRTQNPTGTIQPAGPVQLSDYLNAPPHVSREPYTMKAIRIGKHRDGSRTGVFIYHQLHAREWVTPLVALETASRLLYNYETNEHVRQLVDNLDIFIIACANPDGSHYSVYDYNSQRKNMTNHGDATVSDPARRNSWGVDLNRNFAVGTLWDGYSGASTSTTSSTYCGPHPHSEPEVQNIVWVVENFPNIKFAMDVHSHGGYLMWAPGAYKTAGRVTLPAMDYGTDTYLFASAERMIDAIAEWRLNVVQPARTGPICDVLYSAAGASVDEMTYAHGLYTFSFEITPQRWTGTGWADVGFQPAVPEAIEGAMEFAHGNFELLSIALDYHKDKAPPRSLVEVILEDGTEDVYTALGLERPAILDFEEDGGQVLVFSGPVRIRFLTSEPANVYYTLDGSRPGFDSLLYERAGLREAGEEILIESTTQVNFFAQDVKGNVEKRYNPSSKAQNFNKLRIVIQSPVGALVP